MNEQNQELQRYLEQVTPIFRELFGIAHAITDQYDVAEVAVETAIHRGFVMRNKRGGSMTFNELMRRRTIRYAREQVKANGVPPDGEGTWNGFDGVDISGNVFLAEAAREPLLMRRILMMKFGAGLHSYEIAPLIGMDKRRVRSYLVQFEARVMRRMRNQNASYEKLAKRAAQRELTRAEADVPDTSATFRQLEADMMDVTEADKQGRPLARVVGTVFLTVGILLCVALFWLFAVLMDAGATTAARTVAPAATEEAQQAQP